MYEDKVLTCCDCGNEFAFTAGEQEFYAEKGLAHEPKRCKECRVKRNSAARQPREMYTTVCADCGGEARIPINPVEGRSYYCSECFDKRRNSQI